MSDELIISYSQVQAWQTCHKKWQWSYIEEIVPKSSPDYLRLGTFLHSLLALGYEHLQFGFVTEEVCEVVRDFALTRLSIGMKPEDLGVLTKAIRLVDRYFETIQPTWDEGCTVVGVERHFKQQLYSPKGRTFFLQGYIDLVLRDIDGNLWIIDHKSSASKFWSPLQLQLDGQLSTYSAVLADVFGVGVNFFNTYDYKDFHAQPFSKLYKRMNSYRTAKEKENILENFGVVVDDMLDRSETKNFPYSLTHNCARCPYSELCLMELKGFGTADIRLLTDDSFTKKQDRLEPGVDATAEEDYS